MTRRIVVTGSASGIGRALVTMLSEQGSEVIGIDLPTPMCAPIWVPRTAGGVRSSRSRGE